MAIHTRGGDDTDAKAVAAMQSMWKPALDRLALRFEARSRSG